MDKISITKVVYVIYVASCFWSRVKPRGHCIRYRDIYSRFPLLRIDISAKPALGGEISNKEEKEEKYAVPKRRCRVVAAPRRATPVYGLFYCNNKFPFGRSEFLLIYSCNVDQITLQPQNLIVRQELW